MLRHSGLYHLRDCMFTRHNVPLLCAFVERWQSDTNTFHMPFGEMTITLHDVWFILGVAVEGFPVSTTAERSEMVATCTEILSMNPAEMDTLWIAGGPKFDDIQARCGNKSGAPPTSAARGYIMYLFGHNAVNSPQFLPNGQLNLPNLVQNVNQLWQMQMPNRGPPNPGLLMNGQLRVANGNITQQSVDGNGLMHINQNTAASKDFGSPQVQLNQNVYSPAAAKSQSNAGIINGVNDKKNGWGRSHNKNFSGHHKRDVAQRGFGKMQFHHRQNTQGNSKFNNENRGKGNKNFGVKNFAFSNSSEQTQGGKKRSLMLNYTEQEIRQWREERRKNYPSNANVEKKLKTNSTESKVTDEVAKIRRQQLKEILAKQAELGIEVAEIPSCYLSDSELRTDGRQQKNKVFGKRDRCHNNFDKKGKFHQNDRYSKRQRSENNGSANLPHQSDQFSTKHRLANGSTTNIRTDNKREPSLLKKLLSSDIKRDKKHLLQVFRFMVMNSFFESWPEKPLKFPVVIVKESGDESELVEEKPQRYKGDTCDGITSTTIENHMVCNDDFDDRISDEADALDEAAAGCSKAYFAAAGKTERLQEVGEVLD